MTIDKNKVYPKYRILDAETGEEKHGRYFILKIDADDSVESIAVKLSLKRYADIQEALGRTEYAKEVMRYVCD